MRTAIQRRERWGGAETVERAGSGYRVNYPAHVTLAWVTFLEATVRRPLRQVSLSIPTPTSSTIEPCRPITVCSGDLTKTTVGLEMF